MPLLLLLLLLGFFFRHWEYFFFAIFAVGVVILKGESFEKKMIREPRVLCENNPTDLGFTGAARERKGYIIVVK